MSLVIRPWSHRSLISRTGTAAPVGFWPFFNSVLNNLKKQLVFSGFLFFKEFSWFYEFSFSKEHHCQWCIFFAKPSGPMFLWCFHLGRYFCLWLVDHHISSNGRQPTFQRCHVCDVSFQSRPKTDSIQRSSKIDIIFWDKREDSIASTSM